jgi:glycosyltransferase involved in cell wall biosynthesis
MNTPQISVILPTYNGAKWVAKAIRSVLRQSLRQFEFIIIDDGSVDGTNEIVQKFIQQNERIRHIKNGQNLGIQETRNISLGHAQGEYIAEIDQDDLWLDKDKLKKQLQFLRENQEYVLIGTGVIIVGSDGEEVARYLMPKTDVEIRSKILRMNCFIHSSVMYRKSAVQAVGGYTVEKMSEDHDLWLRLGRQGKFANLPDYAVQYYLNMNGYNSQDKFIRLKQNLSLIKEHKDFYPNHVLATIVGWLKIVFMPIFMNAPSNIKGPLLKMYKKI